MKSAFGIEHDGIAKSILPSGVAKPITQMNGLERSILRDDVAYRGFSRKEGFKPYKGTIGNPNSSAGRQIWGNHGPTPGGPKVKTELHALEAPTKRTSNGQLSRVMASSQPNGRGGGKIKVYSGADDVVVRHEMAHIAPRRNIVNLQRRTQDPVRLGREEGRADFIGHGHATLSRYPGNKEFQTGYNEVQTKMAAAKGQSVQRRRRLFGKSFVAGAYKPAHLLDEAERAEVAARTARRTKSKFKNPPNYGANWAARKLKPFPTRSTGSKITITEHKQGLISSLVSRRTGKTNVGSSRSNGLGGGQIKLLADHPDKAETLKHELAHVQVKRNPVRFKERMKDPERSGREEGRADYLASGKMTLGAYPGNEAFQRGYSAVQYRMQLARNVRNMNRRRQS